MKGIASKVLIVLGIIFILAAILWWAIAVNALVKLPDDIDIVNEYEGKMTFYIDPLTRERLPEGGELQSEMAVEQAIKANAAAYDSSTGIVDEVLTVKLEIGALPVEKTSEFAYALDRKNNENKSDERAYAWVPQNVVDRAGTHYPLFPFDTSKDEEYLMWKSEVGRGIPVEFVEEADKEGVTVYNYKLNLESTEVVPEYVEYSPFGLKPEITFEELKPTLAAMGVNVDDFVAAASRAMTPEDLQVLNQALQAPIPVKYSWDTAMEFSVEPKTGVPVDIAKDADTLSMRPDTSGMSALGAVLEKYAANPALGPYVAQFDQLVSRLGGEQKVFEYTIKSTADTVTAALKDAKDNTSRINLVKVYIPWALLILGALILIIGLLIGGEAAPPTEAAGSGAKEVREEADKEG